MDYVTKPFEIDELLARIVVQLRNTTKSEDARTLTYDEIFLDTATHEVRVSNRNVKLTKTEFAILKLLMEHPKQIITKTISKLSGGLDLRWRNHKSLQFLCTFLNSFLNIYLIE